MAGRLCARGGRLLGLVLLKKRTEASTRFFCRVVVADASVIRASADVPGPGAALGEAARPGGDADSGDFELGASGGVELGHGEPFRVLGELLDALPGESEHCGGIYAGDVLSEQRPHGLTAKLRGLGQFRAAARLVFVGRVLCRYNVIG